MGHLLVVLGGSNALREVIGIVEALNAVGHDYQIVGVLDDSDELSGKVIHQIPVLGKLDHARNLTGCRFVFAIGSLATQRDRSSIVDKLGIPSERFMTLVHPTAEIDSTASVGNGCILHKGVSVGPGAQVGDFVIIAVNSAVGPDTTIDDFVLVTSFVLLLSRVVLKKSCYVGSMSCVIEDVVIGSLARIGVGSIVNRDVPDGTLAVGNPARILGKN